MNMQSEAKWRVTSTEDEQEEETRSKRKAETK